MGILSKTEYQEREKELMQCEECSEWADGKMER